MRMSPTARLILAAFVLVMVAGVVTVRIAFPRIQRWGVGLHQRSVTRSLAAWGTTDARITDDASAVHAAQMVGYISSYYVPGPGYRGPLEIEAALERQRHESIASIVASLQRYTGLDYGTNVERWIQWADRRKSSEPSAPANRHEPSASSRASGAGGG